VELLLIDTPRQQLRDLILEALAQSRIVDVLIERLCVARVGRALQAIERNVRRRVGIAQYRDHGDCDNDLNRKSDRIALR